MNLRNPAPKGKIYKQRLGIKSPRNARAMSVIGTNLCACASGGGEGASCSYQLASSHAGPWQGAVNWTGRNCAPLVLQSFLIPQPHDRFVVVVVPLAPQPGPAPQSSRWSSGRDSGHRAYPNRRPRLQCHRLSRSTTGPNRYADFQTKV